MMVVFGSLGLAYRCGSRAPWVVFLSNMGGMTPLMAGALLGRRDVGRALRAHGANVALTSRSGLTAAGWARLAGHPETLANSLALR